MTTEETKKPLITQKHIWVCILLICYTFILSGGANIGSTRFLMALPFMPLALLISMRVLKKTVFRKLTFILIPFSIILNITLEKNPIAFPILCGGEIEIISDGFQGTYSDGSGGFYDKEPEKAGDHNVTYKELKKGEKYKVTGIVITAPDFGTKINLQTTIGQFSHSNYQDTSYSSASVLTNKEVQATWLEDLGFLMYWPLLFIFRAPLGLVISCALLVLLGRGINRLPKS